MGAIRKPRFSDGDVVKAMDGFFNNLLVPAERIDTCVATIV
ncbi:protein of unknown function [uncultured Woeseiaceae bacterium]|uniref:Uncharacterized protein n=1 Tax=uncultured Woeseiaceae bacterium TaxID=1983305 RepID=A0A7D9H643_9GAMM|nr:protein of unknown function [uncultured Woeseiaceae bacterium]